MRRARYGNAGNEWNNAAIFSNHGANATCDTSRARARVLPHSLASKSRCFQDHVPRCHLHKSAEFPAVSGALPSRSRKYQRFTSPSSSIVKKPRQNRVLREATERRLGCRIASHRVSIVGMSLPVTRTRYRNDSRDISRLYSLYTHWASLMNSCGPRTLARAIEYISAAINHLSRGSRWGRTTIRVLRISTRNSTFRATYETIEQICDSGDEASSRHGSCRLITLNRRVYLPSVFLFEGCHSLWIPRDKSIGETRFRWPQAYVAHVLLNIYLNIKEQYPKSPNNPFIT